MSDFFSHVVPASADPILGLTAAFQDDPRECKVNLSVGVYKTEDLKTPILSCVKMAEKELYQEEQTKSYLPIEGDTSYLEQAMQLLFGKTLFADCKNKLSAFQCLGGTGALRLGGEFLREELGKTLYISHPSWPNHRGVFSQCGMEVHTYPYYDRIMRTLQFDDMVQCIANLPPKSILVLHACCHNPSGADLDRSQWEQVCQICLEKELFPFFDAAYLGFGEGFEEDAWPMRLFLERGVEFFLALSFSKNFGLYGERVGALISHLREGSVDAVQSRIKVLARRNYSNPPMHGAKVVSKILQSKSLIAIWEKELLEMRQRIHAMRTLFVETLCAKSHRQEYTDLLQQRGLFSFCHLSETQVLFLQKEYGIYMTADGRINVAGLNPQHIEYVVDAILAAGG